MIALLAAFMLLVSVSMAAAEFCGGQRVPLDTSVGSLPFVHMRIGSLEGNFVIDTASTFSEIDARALGVAHGSRVRLEGSNFPTIGWGVF